MNSRVLNRMITLHNQDGPSVKQKIYQNKLFAYANQVRTKAQSYVNELSDNEAEITDEVLENLTQLFHRSCFIRDSNHKSIGITNNEKLHDDIETVMGFFEEELSSYLSDSCPAHGHGLDLIEEDYDEENFDDDLDNELILTLTDKFTFRYTEPCPPYIEDAPPCYSEH